MPRALLTPTSKADLGGHDAPLSSAEIFDRGLLNADQWEQLSAYSLALYERGVAEAATRGLILADTKYEFGL